MESLIYEILIEAANKRVNTDRPYNIVFNSNINLTNLNQEEQTNLLNRIKRILTIVDVKIDMKINKENISLNTISNEDLFIPTLNINNLTLFIEKLNEYLICAKKFYDKNYYDSLEYEDKTILTLLWSNATPEDFNNPIQFIEKRINFIKDLNFNNYLEPKMIGKSSILLDSQIKVSIQKEPIYQETPYSFNIEVLNNENSSEKYVLPKIRFGIDNNKCTIMAIQNNIKNNNEETKFIKKIKRCLNKVNQNFQKEENNDNVKHPENLTGIVPSFLVSTTIFLSTLQSMRITDIEIATFLPVRWNSKELKYLKIKEIENKKGIDEKIIEDKYKDNILEHYNIQRNLSDKLIRNFRRLAYHFNNIDITSYPYEIDDFMHLKLNNDYDCNNDLLNELYMLSSLEQQKRK